MKQAVNFRLDHQAILALSLLEKQLQASKTDIVEQAIKLYAKKTLPKKNTLIQYAGSMSHEEAESMLKQIKKSKRNKTLKVDL